MDFSTAYELDRSGAGESSVHRLDARAKLAAALVFIVCVASFPKHALAPLAPLAFLPWAWSIVGRVPARRVARWLLAAAPFAVLAGAANPWLDRAPLLTLGGWTLTGGWASLLSILLRFVLCAWAAAALAATTPLPALGRALAALGAPRAFAAQLLLLYQYLFLLTDEGRRIGQARRLRDPRRRHMPPALAQKIFAWFLLRAWERAERTYCGMKLRGFNGILPVLRPLYFRPRDAAFLAAVAGFCLAARLLPLTDWLGQRILDLSAVSKII